MTNHMEGGWWLRAACLGLPLQMFFPDHASQNYAAHLAPVCGSCPVRADCLDDQLAYERRRKDSHKHGWFGGVSPGDRAQMLKGEPERRRVA